jgi:quercetin dioxygenase-like cupin family protein
LLCASCVKGTPTNPILPAGVSPTPLPQPEYVGIGRYEILSELTSEPSFGGVPYVTFAEVREPSGSSEPHRDVPGYVYAYQGSVLVSREAGDGLKQSVIDQGKAGWVSSGSEYTNTSSTEHVWYFVAPRSILQRAAPLPFANARLLYASDDLPQPAAGKQVVFQLALITMDVGGRTSSHSHAGSETFYVLKGTVALATNAGQRMNITAGSGATIKPGVVMQLRVVGDQPVQILSFFITPEGMLWQTNLQTLP